MSVRNFSYMPIMGKEGFFDPPIPDPPIQQNAPVWYANLTPNERLYYHQTLNVLRKDTRYHQTLAVPKDSLDLVLQSYYDHSKETFPDKVDCVYQFETLGISTFRVLRNTKRLKNVESETLGHPLKIGGIKEKISPHSVKLINVGHHTQITNKGYSRQPADGTFFCY